jgi:prepilin-type N-terminal cleavage/methylation domain-containing protein
MSNWYSSSGTPWAIRCRAVLCGGKNLRGFTLIETLVTLAIFTVILGGFFTAYLSQLKYTARETAGAESDVELTVARNILLRDLNLAGYGLADDYSATTGFSPEAAHGSSTDPDDLILMGTALSMGNRASHHWTYVSDNGSPATFHVWGDAREDVETDDRVILMEPSTKKLLVQGDEPNNWLFLYNGSNADLKTRPPSPSPGTAYDNPPIGTLVYALASSDAARPYWTVRYHLGGNRPKACATGSKSLLRAESDKTDDPAGGASMLSCVLDMEVAYGLDRDENGTIDTWDDGGNDYVKDYTASLERRRLKEIKVYLLVQAGAWDKDYTFPLASIRVGEGASIGRDIDLSAEQRHYRWRLVTVSKTLRNLR